MGIFFSLLKQEIFLAYRKPSAVFQPLLFFIIVITLFPLAVSPESNVLRELAPGVIWVAALLATLLSMERLFQFDYQNGYLEQLVLAPQSLSLITLAKIISHWLLTGLPLVLISPVLGVLLNLTGHEITAIMITLLLGTPILSLLGAIGSALTLSIRGSGVLLTLLILPLYMPTLIFGASGCSAAMANLPYSGQCAFLGALLILALLLAPLATAVGLRISLSE